MGLSPDEVDFFFDCPNPFSHTEALWSTHAQTEMSKADNICEPIV
jgi:hypothetical protein